MGVGGSGGVRAAEGMCGVVWEAARVWGNCGEG